MKLIDRLNQKQQYVVNLIKNISIRRGVTAYIVGGAVRDILLNSKINDIDICITEDPIMIIKELPCVSEYKYYKEFQTSNIVFDNGIEIDLIRCRKEYYIHNGALPTIEPSTIEEDLYRRDFTINAIAYDVVNEKIIDPYGGISDIGLNLIKKIHKNSYLEDPTRIFRAIRYSTRYDFKIYDKEEIQECVNRKNIFNISNDRIIREIMLMCSEDKWMKNIITCEHYKIINLNDSIINKKSELFNYFNLEDRILNVFCVLEDPQFIQIFINNSVLKKQLVKSLKKYIQLLQSLDIKTNKTLSNYEIYTLFKNYNLSELKMLSINDMYKYKVINYIENIMKIKLNVTGYHISELGISNGKDIGTIMGFLKKLRMNTLIPVEKEYLIKNLREILKNVKNKN